MAQTSVATELAMLRSAAPAASPVPYSAALEYCRRVTRGNYENFSVASWLLPRHLRPHFYAIYAYCRIADDLADETGSPAESLRLLDAWQNQLDRCYAGDAEHPVFVALATTIREFAIPKEPFERLLIAFRQDQVVTQYDTSEDVLAYCQNSANPVGRLVLYLGRCHDARRAELSDSICTGLQLANFCQDVARDWRKGRVYLPTSTLAEHGYTPEMLAGEVFNEPFRQALRQEVDRAEAALRAGEPLVDLVPPELRLDVALFLAGGLSVLEAIRGVGYNVWRTRPTISKLHKARLLVGCWWRIRRTTGREPRL